MENGVKTIYKIKKKSSENMFLKLSTQKIMPGNYDSVLDSRFITFSPD